MTTTNDIENVATNFRRNLGNGVLAAQHLSTLIDSVVSSRDTTIFARELMRVEKEKRDAGALNVMRGTFRSVFPGAKIGKKNGQYTIQIRGINPDTDAVARMHGAVKEKVSIRGNFLKLTRGETEAPAFDVLKWAERQAKAHPAELNAMIAALQAQRS